MNTERLPIDSYRFASGTEPTDEMLEQIMAEVTQIALEKHLHATDAHFADMEADIAAKEAYYANQISDLLNGNN